MKRRKSPQLKKRDEYDKDHRTLMEHPHAFRKNWPKKKAYANRKSRRKLDALLQEGGDVTPAMAKVAIGPRSIHKNFVMSLRTMTQFRRKRRQRTER